MNRYEALQQNLRATPRTWLITGVAGFIGSNLLEQLLKLNQRVAGLDNFSTGKRHNLEEVRSLVTPEQWARFSFTEGNICHLEDCRKACESVDYILHQAALGSVPRSLADPIATHTNNVSGFLNMIVAAKERKIARFVYASSSSVYGDHPLLPKVESEIGQPLSPYAATKRIGEMYASVFQRAYGLSSIGLRYFNVFGPRQDPEGAYAAVIPKWYAALLNGTPIHLNGDGQTSRDFCFIENVVQANLLAATSDAQTSSKVYNIAFGQRTTLHDLFFLIRDSLVAHKPDVADRQPILREERAGDVRHSHADILLAQQHLGYDPAFSLKSGLLKTREWYQRR
jgi:UDP-N-acetylglucosamine 4-epimerase